MVRIACLHTAQSNVPVFDTALREIGLKGVTLRHEVRAELLAAAERQGWLAPDVAAETVAALRSLWAGADVVLLTCSTLGPVVEAAALSAPVPVLRVDAALAAEAVQEGGRVTVLCAVGTTVEPTQTLFEAAARMTGAEVVVRLVPGAWNAFRAGQIDRYLKMIAEAADEAVRSGATRVALAQASMTGASALVTAERPPLTSPAAGIRAAAARAGYRSRGPVGPASHAT